MSAYSEYLRPNHRPGLEAAGEDEWDDTPAPSGEVGMVPVAPYLPPILCKHGRRDCFTCDMRECEFHQRPCSCWARQATAKPPAEPGF